MCKTEGLLRDLYHKNINKKYFMIIDGLKFRIIILVYFLSLFAFFYKSDSVFENGHF